MRIIIAGAGDIGFHLAKLLSKEQQDIVLIDTNQDVLDYAATHTDVLTIRGDASSTSVLQEAGVAKSNMLLAVTASENTNLVTAILAKKLGVRNTIARVNNPEYLVPEQKQVFRELGIDKLISPIDFACNEIDRLLKFCQVTDNFEFEEGAVTLIGITLDDSSNLLGRTVIDVDNSIADITFKPVAILRGSNTILPRDNTVFERCDHIYFLANKQDINRLVSEAGKQLKKINRVMIIGGGIMGYRTAKLLEDQYNVTIVEADKSLCKKLTEKLDNTLIIKGDPSNVELLREEGLPDMDAFVALTPNAETNIITSLMAEEAGVFKTIALVDNTDYTHISQNIGVDTLINKKLIAANNIFRFIRKGKIEAITSLHGVDAEVIEFVIHRNNKLTKHPIKELHFPENAIIGSVIRGKENIVPTGDFQLMLHDKVIIVCTPQSIYQVEALFK